MPAIDFKSLKESVTVQRLLASVGWQLTTRCQSGEVRGRCPLHGSRSKKSRSFAISPGGRAWYCHRCKVGGNVLDLAQRLFGSAGLYAAALRLCGHLSITVPTVASTRRDGRPC